MAYSLHAGTLNNTARVDRIDTAAQLDNTSSTVRLVLLPKEKDKVWISM
jgi:hypothetical protein